MVRNPHIFHRTWHQFRPHRLFKRTPYAPPAPQAESDIFAEVGDYVEKRLPHRRPKPAQLESLVKQLRGRAESSNRPEDWLACLFARAPKAAEAQQRVDQHENGYHSHQARVYELIDFNDTFVATILSMNQHMRSEFTVKAKQQCDRMSKIVRLPAFTNEQWTAIVRGLTREIAVYQAARDRGFDATMPNRTGDAIGIDLQVRDPETGRYINIDVKTPSSFRHRLEELTQEGRITDKELVEADDRSYVIEHNGHGTSQVEVIVLCILPDRFGEFGDFRLLNSEPMRQMLNFLIREHGLSDSGYGIYR